MMSQLLRYAPVISLIKKTRPERILEVGCGSQGLGKFLSCRFVGVDRDFTDFTGTSHQLSPSMLPVLASGAHLPFKDHAFDFVVLLDVLEHLASHTRVGILAECDRLSRGWIVIGFPCGALAEDHDREFLRWLRQRSLRIPMWLHEHMDHPYPTVQEVSRVFSFTGAKIGVSENAWLPAHRQFMRWEARDPYARYSAAMSDLLAPTAWNWKGHRNVTNVLRSIIRPTWPLLRLLERRPGYRKLIFIEK